jgi:hypothetical protein
MKAVFSFAAAAPAACFLALMAHPAAAQEKLRSCAVGQRVVMPGGYPGTVSAVYGQGGCTVKDAKGLESSWAAFMLSAAPGSPAPKEAPIPPTLKAGTYQCFGGAAGNMKLRFGPGATYANEQGAKGVYIMRPSGQMQFTSGPWKGFYAKTLDNGRVGLTSKPDGTFYQMTCDPR